MEHVPLVRQTISAHFQTIPQSPCQLNLCSIPGPHRLPLANSCTSCTTCRIWQRQLQLRHWLCQVIEAIGDLSPSSSLADSSSSLRRLVATFFMSRCDRRHKLCTRRTEIADLVALSLSHLDLGAIQSLCQQKLFLTAATWNWRQYLGSTLYQSCPVLPCSQRRLIGPDYKYISLAVQPTWHLALHSYS